MPEDLTLYHYNQVLQDLIAFREERVADKDDPVTDEDLKVIDHQIEECVAGEIQKVDSVAAWILWSESQIAVARTEVDRLKRFINSKSSAVENIKGYVKDILLSLPQPKKGGQRLQGDTHVLSVRTNGGLVGLEVTDETMVPNEYRDAVVTMPFLDWDRIEAFCPNTDKVTVTLNNGRIREALEQDCENCLGKEDAWPDPCPVCGGTGKRGVPGCRLKERGQSIQVR